MSVVFKWESRDFYDSIDACRYDECLPYILKYTPKEGKVIEAGCGLGRYVAFLSQSGYHVEGIEISEETVNQVKQIDPGIRIRQGDVSCFDIPDNHVSGVISLGVVEHFVCGPDKPLNEIYRILKPGSYAVITVPSMNYLRQIKRLMGYYFTKEILKNIARKYLHKKLAPLHIFISKNKYFKYFPIFASGDFYEYRLTKKEFEQSLIKAGFVIIKSVPIGHMDGIYHEFGKAFVAFKGCRLYPNLLGKILNRVLQKIPFFHNHMHLCAVRKIK